MPSFVPPELCRLVDAPPSGAAWVHEIKFDGYRMQLRVEGGRAVLRTRKGLDWSTRFPEITAEGRGLLDGILDGEICALNEKSLPSFANLQAALSDGKTGGLLFYVFDLLFLQGADLRSLALSERKALLKTRLSKSKGLAHFRYVDHFATPGQKMLESACKTGLEGIVSKRLDAPYRSGRGDLWTKAKCRGGQEVVIGGWWGDAKSLRSIQVGTFDGKDFVYRGSVGTGFNARNLPVLLKALNKIKRDRSPFTSGAKPPRAKDIKWTLPTLVAEVEAEGFTRDGLLRQAAFKALREDKDAASVTAEIPVPVPAAKAETHARKEIPMAQKKAPAAIRSRSDAVVANIAITHPDKILWPKSKLGAAVTKLDLAHYYESAAMRILPHIAGRPLSLVRAPDGIGGQRFFQRHVLAGVKGAVPIAVAGEKEPYHSVDSVEGLVALAQAAVLEFHPWGSRAGDPETPERLIFDLDPAPELSFERVIEAAKGLRQRLEACGLEAFVKTTGGKGLHVVTAIKGTAKKPPTWPEAKEFARALCESVAGDDPSRYTTNMSKKQRGGKIFLDYLRNDRTATAVGPWSPRAREGATIAMPLSWSQIKKGFDPKTFTLEGAAPLLKRADPWKELEKSAGALDAARKRLGR